MKPPDMVVTLTSDMDDVRSVLKVARRRIVDVPNLAPLADTAEVVLGEALNNVVEHAYQFDGGNPIRLEIRFEKAALDVMIEDHGIAMPNGSLPKGHMPVIDPDDRNSLPEGGFGWAMLRELTAGLTYHRENDRNRLTFSIPKAQS